jgi:hypothetical protein
MHRKPQVRAALCCGLDPTLRPRLLRVPLKEQNCQTHMSSIPTALCASIVVICVLRRRWLALNQIGSLCYVNPHGRAVPLVVNSFGRGGRRATTAVYRNSPNFCSGQYRSLAIPMIFFAGTYPQVLLSSLSAALSPSTK